MTNQAPQSTPPLFHTHAYLIQWIFFQIFETNNMSPPISPTQNPLGPNLVMKVMTGGWLMSVGGLGLIIYYLNNITEYKNVSNNNFDLRSDGSELVSS